MSKLVLLLSHECLREFITVQLPVFDSAPSQLSRHSVRV